MYADGKFLSEGSEQKKYHFHFLCPGGRDRVIVSFVNPVILSSRAGISTGRNEIDE